MRAHRGIGWGLIVLAVGLAANSLLGPLASDVIAYRYGTSMTNQGIGLDAVALLLVAPVAALAGVVTLRGHAAGPVLGLGPAAFVAYMVPQYVVGPDYQRLPGNNERFFGFHLTLFVLAVALLLAAWQAIDWRLPPASRAEDRRRAWVMAGVAAFIVVRWTPVVLALAAGGDAGPGYRDNPTALMLVALLDLGLVVPAAVTVAVGLRRGAAWARKGAYAVIGWFALVPVSVAAMAVTMQLRGDPDASTAESVGLGAAALIFLAAAAWLYRPLRGGRPAGPAPGRLPERTAGEAPAGPVGRGTR
jgi:hypothetical protein